MSVGHAWLTYKLILRWWPAVVSLRQAKLFWVVMLSDEAFYMDMNPLSVTVLASSLDFDGIALGVNI